VVLSGLRAVGANPQQASSGLLALCLVVGAGVVFLAWRSRLPVTLAWSTPGAALLAVAGIPDGGWPAAVGAFLVTGVLIAVTGLVRPLGRLVGSIPTSLAQAMLAGVLLPEMEWTAPSWSPGAVAGIALPLYIVTMASQNVPGLALLGTLAGSAASALAEPGERTGAVVTLLVAASGLGFMGIGAAFWALLAGLLVREVLKVRNRPQGKTAG